MGPGSLFGIDSRIKRKQRITQNISYEKRNCIDRCFFMAYGKMWRIKFRDKALENQVKTDSHSPDYYRSNGPLSNFEEFHKAFNIPKGSKMRRDEIIAIW